MPGCTGDFALEVPGPTVRARLSFSESAARWNFLTIARRTGWRTPRRFLLLAFRHLCAQEGHAGHCDSNHEKHGRDLHEVGKVTEREEQEAPRSPPARPPRNRQE